MIGLAIFIIGLWLAYEVGGTIANGDLRTLEFAASGAAALGACTAILRNWRTGYGFFLVWLLFEDLARKYMGNGLALFFGKDILAALTYVSLFVAIRKHRDKVFSLALLAAARDFSSGPARSRSSTKTRRTFSMACSDSKCISFTSR